MVKVYHDENLEVDKTGWYVCVFYGKDVFISKISQSGVILLEKIRSLWYSGYYKFKDMAITKNAKRGIRVSERKRVVNDKLRRTMKEAVKTVRKDVIAKDKKAITTDLSLAFKALDKAAKRGTIKKGQADRKKSRLAKSVAKLDTKTK